MAAKSHDYCANIQNLMDIAYARWQADKEMKKDAFIAQLTTAEAVAVHLGNMNYQVENGGWSQYWYNSYATRDTVAAVRGYLSQIVAHAKATNDPRLAAAEEVARLQAAFDRALDGNYDPNSYTSASYNNRSTYDVDEEEDEEDNGPQVEHLSTPYYAVNDDFMCLAEDWLKATFVLPPLPVEAEPAQSS